MSKFCHDDFAIPLLIRADASVEIGTGHVMRCLAIAQAWQDTGGSVKIAMAESTPAILDRLTMAGLEILPIAAPPGSIEDAQQTVQWATTIHAQWIVADGYHFSAAYQRSIKEARQTDPLQLLILDDYGHASFYYADVILNQNLAADVALYRDRAAYTQLLLGTNYTLLRREFRHWVRQPSPLAATANKILVTLGGSDPANVTLQVVQALQAIAWSGLQVIVVVGGSNPHYGAIDALIRSAGVAMRLFQNATNMPALMAWAEVTITAGGSTCWELAWMRSPSIILVLAENQRANAEKLSSWNAMVNLGWHDAVTSEVLQQAIWQLCQAETNRTSRQTMIQQQEMLIDGQGLDRVLGYLQQKNCMRERT